jgi:hypothetical protein
MSPSHPADDDYGPPIPLRSGAVGRARVPPPPARDRPPPPEPLPEIEPLPPPRPRGHYHGKRRRENPWVSYGLIIAVPLFLVLLIVGFSALPPYTPNSRAQSQPDAASAGTASAGGTSAAPAGSPAALAPLRVYEAEDGTHNTLGPTTKLRAVAGASGGQVVTRVGHGTPAGDVKFNAVTADASGRYTVTIYYLLADTEAHRLALWVDGRGPTILSFPPLRAADRIGTLRTTVTLASGTNTIRFSNATTAYGPDLDRITVAPQ